MAVEIGAFDIKHSIRAKLDTLDEHINYYQFLIPTSLIQKWHEQCDVQSAFRDCALTPYSRLDLVHQDPARESQLNFWDRHTNMMFARKGYQHAQIYVERQGEEHEKTAHWLFLKEGKDPKLVNVVSTGLVDRIIEKTPSPQDLEYWRLFINGALDYSLNPYQGFKLLTASS